MKTPPFRVASDSELLLRARRLNPQDGQFGEAGIINRFPSDAAGWAALQRMYDEKSKRRDYAGFSFVLRVKLEDIPILSLGEMDQLMADLWSPVHSLPVTGHWIIVHGSPLDGMIHTGPFTDRQEANLYAEQKYGEHDWWVIDLERPA